MTTLNYAIQCKDTTSGEVGCFAFQKPIKSALSPVFPNLVQFYDWAKENGYSTTQIGGDFLIIKD